jgi:hypothetical protein
MQKHKLVRAAKPDKIINFIFIEMVPKTKWKKRKIKNNKIQIWTYINNGLIFSLQSEVSKNALIWAVQTLFRMTLFVT